MITEKENSGINNWLPYLLGVVLLVSFFLPWVSWQGHLIKGVDLPMGNFFKVSGTEFGLENPFPQLSFTFYVFWLIAVGAIACIILKAMNKKASLIYFITGALSLSLVTVFFLFTKQLIMLGIGKNVFVMLRPALWIHAFAAIGVILTVSSTPYILLKKVVWILLGPVFVFISFLLIERSLMNETHTDTVNVKAAYTVTAAGLISEFNSNDSLANKKYREKIVVVNGAASQVELLSDSTTNIKFTDTTGSYIIFSLDKDQFSKAGKINAGDPVSLKGSCSGSVYSEILGTTSISFKRAIINKQ